MNAKEVEKFLSNQKITHATYWYAFWFINESYESLNDYVMKASRRGEKEHAEMYCKVIALKHLSEQGTPCPECSGSGEMDEVIKESFASERISPRYKKVACNKCQED